MILCYLKENEINNIFNLILNVLNILFDILIHYFWYWYNWILQETIWQWIRKIQQKYKGKKIKIKNKLTEEKILV